jgi:hypothetical protein
MQYKEEPITNESTYTLKHGYNCNAVGYLITLEEDKNSYRLQYSNEYRLEILINTYIVMGMKEEVTSIR